MLVNAVLVRDAAGRPLSIRTTLVDVTDRRRYERELLQARRRAEQLAGVVNASSDAIMLATPDGTILTWNRGAELLFGWSADEVVGRKATALTVPPDRQEEYQAVLEELRSGREVRLETVRVDRAGAASTSRSRRRPTWRRRARWSPFGYRSRRLRASPREERLRREVRIRSSARWRAVSRTR